MRRFFKRHFLSLGNRIRRFGGEWNEDGIAGRVLVADPFMLENPPRNPDTDGALLLCGRGSVSFGCKANAAERAGAAGMIVINDSEKWPHTMTDSKGKLVVGSGMTERNFSGEASNCTTPCVLISQASGDRLLTWIRAHPFEALHIKIQSRELKVCSICQEPFNSQAARLPCRHHFHEECINHWLQKNRTCPLCRFQLPIDTRHDLLFWRGEMKVYFRILLLSQAMLFILSFASSLTGLVE